MVDRCREKQHGANDGGNAEIMRQIEGPEEYGLDNGSGKQPWTCNLVPEHLTKLQHGGSDKIKTCVKEADTVGYYVLRSRLVLVQ